MLRYTMTASDPLPWLRNASRIQTMWHNSGASGRENCGLMITTITVENFKGVKRQKFVFNRVSAVVDEDAIARMRAVAKDIAG